ncbi:hypothetical protein P3632_24095, partial [Vibrio parahaemolyticus]|nr:hypothetical protein [Vibrio parahaemolyticus]
MANQTTRFFLFTFKFFSYETSGEYTVSSSIRSEPVNPRQNEILQLVNDRKRVQVTELSDI